MQLTVQPNYYLKITEYKKSQEGSTSVTSNPFVNKNYSDQLCFTGNDYPFSYDRSLNEKLSKMNWFQKNILGGKKRAEGETTLELIDFRMKQCVETEKNANTMLYFAKLEKEKIKKRALGLKEGESVINERIKNNELASETKIRQNEQASDAKIFEQEQAMNLSEIESKNRIQETEQTSNAGILQREKFSNAKIFEQEQAMNLAEAESKNQIVEWEETAKQKRAIATQINNEGFQMKEEALQIREAAIKTKREAFNMKEEALQIDENAILEKPDSYFLSTNSDKLKKEQIKILKEKETFFDEFLAGAKGKETEVDDLKRQVASLKIQKSKEIKILNQKIENLRSVMKPADVSDGGQKVGEIIGGLTDKVKNNLSDSKAKQQKGWGRIAGFGDVKSLLEKSFIQKLSPEQIAMGAIVPNGILIYGPDGVGKTTFAKALAEQSECNFEEINMLQPENKIFEDLFNAANRSKMIYKQTEGIRTIILLDGCDKIKHLCDEVAGNTPSGNSVAQKIDSFLNRCSEEYKCTILMTTNRPINNTTGVFSSYSSSVPVKILLAPPNKANWEEIFKFYLKDFAGNTLNYAKLAEGVIKANESGQAFSVSRIENIIAGFSNLEITEKDLLKKIKDIGPDLSINQMKKFGKEIFEAGRRII